MKRIFATAVAAFLGGTIAAGTGSAATEQPEYTVIAQEGAVELREYGPTLVAQTDVTGQRQRAMSRGFRIIAEYIFGNNAAAQKVAMTSPVTQQRSEVIAMTSPVIQQPDTQDGSWTIGFIMPAKYTMETLPKPLNSAVEIVEVPAKRYVAVQFSGFGDVVSLEKNTAILKNYLKQNGLTASADPTFAFYDGPWVRPDQRRNEVMIELAPN